MTRLDRMKEVSLRATFFPFYIHSKINEALKGRLGWACLFMSTNSQVNLYNILLLSPVSQTFDLNNTWPMSFHDSSRTRISSAHIYAGLRISSISLINFTKERSREGIDPNRLLRDVGRYGRCNVVSYIDHQKLLPFT